MGSMMKGDRDVLTIKAEGSGPVGHYLVTADSKGNVKGYAANPNVILPANAAGKLDVGGSLGVGLLTVIKDLGLKEPYTGTCELVSGEIAEDLTYYFASSEQTPSSVGLGVLMTKTIPSMSRVVLLSSLCLTQRRRQYQLSKRKFPQ